MTRDPSFNPMSILTIHPLDTHSTASYQLYMISHLLKTPCESYNCHVFRLLSINELKFHISQIQNKVLTIILTLTLMLYFRNNAPSGIKYIAA